ncbi:MAG: hypothetical protein GYB67_13830 [Chloroflexi bacterium]|nr:hypothetical protein [Chloroflexota bacterium]
MFDVKFEIDVFHAMREVDPAVWDAVNTRPFTSWHWNRFCENLYPDDQPLYILLSHHGEPVATAAFWFIRREILPPLPIVMRYGVEALLQRWPLLVCRAPVANVSGLTLPSSPLYGAALRALVDAVQAYISEQGGVSFLLFDYLDAQQAQSERWANRYSFIDFSEPGTYLDLPHPDFDSYVQQLGKSARKDFRRHTNRASDAGIEIKAHDAIVGANEARPLIRNVESHHGSTPNPLTDGLLNGSFADLDAVWLTAEQNGQMIGCGLLIGERGAKFLTLLGLDYDVKYTYFQLMYAAIRHAIESDTQRLYGGSGAYELKQRLGFQLKEDRYSAFTTRIPLLGKLARNLVSN